jgi:hypothetical protein
MRGVIDNVTDEIITGYPVGFPRVHDDSGSTYYEDLQGCAAS